MSDLGFISDVIYGLKQEYPFAGRIKRSTANDTDPRTGIQTRTPIFDIYVPKMIRLPFSWKKFLVNKAKGGIVEVGVQEILVDKKDVRVVLQSGDYVEADGKRLDVGKVDDYTYAFILYVKSVEGMPID